MEQRLRCGHFIEGPAGRIFWTSETDKGISPHVNVHRFAAAGTCRSIFNFQSTLAKYKLPIAYLATVSLLAILGLSELIKCIRAASGALFIGRHNRVLDFKQFNFLCFYQLKMIPTRRIYKNGPISAVFIHADKTISDGNILNYQLLCLIC
jgi:hypothetical protein